MKLSQCLNWKVITAVIGLIILGYVFWPDSLGRFSLLLVLLVCPLSMVAMMWGMNKTNSCDRSFEDPNQTNTKRTFTCPECLLEYEDKAWAEKCLAWCKEHHSCNIAITKHAVSK